MSVDTCIEDLSNIHLPDQFDLCQVQSSNEHCQMKSISFHLNKHIVFEATGPRGPIPDLWTPQVNTTRHAQNKVLVSSCLDFMGYGKDKCPFMSTHLKHRVEFCTQDS